MPARRDHGDDERDARRDTAHRHEDRDVPFLDKTRDGEPRAEREDRPDDAVEDAVQNLSPPPALHRLADIARKQLHDAEEHRNDEHGGDADARERPHIALRVGEQSRDGQRDAEERVEKEPPDDGEDAADRKHARKRAEAALSAPVLVFEPAAAQHHEEPVADIRHDEAHEHAVKDRHHGVGVHLARVGHRIGVGERFEVGDHRIVFAESGHFLVFRGLGKFEIHRPRRGKFAPYGLFRVFGHERFQKEGTLGAAQLFVKGRLFRLVADVIAVNFEGARLAAELCRLLFERIELLCKLLALPFQAGIERASRLFALKGAGGKPGARKQRLPFLRTRLVKDEKDEHFVVLFCKLLPLRKGGKVFADILPCVEGQRAEEDARVRRAAVRTKRLFDRPIDGCRMQGALRLLKKGALFRLLVGEGVDARDEPVHARAVVCRRHELLIAHFEAVLFGARRPLMLLPVRVDRLREALQRVLQRGVIGGKGAVCGRERRGMLLLAVQFDLDGARALQGVEHGVLFVRHADEVEFFHLSDHLRSSPRSCRRRRRCFRAACSSPLPPPCGRRQRRHHIRQTPPHGRALPVRRDRL